MNAEQNQVAQETWAVMQKEGIARGMSTQELTNLYRTVIVPAACKMFVPATADEVRPEAVDVY